MRSLLAFGLVVLLGVGGCTNAPPAPSIRPGTPTATTTTPSGNPATSTTSSAEPTPTAVASEPDRYPAELANRPFEIRPFPDGSVTIVGLLGRPERLTLPPGERLLDVVGELAFTAVDAEGGVSVSVWTIPTGDRITGPAFVPGLLGPYGIVAGSYVILVSTDGPQGIASAIRAVSTVDGSVRQIAPGSSPVDLVDPVREVVVSSKGDRVLTTLCATSVDFVGNCRPADLIDIEKIGRASCRERV